MDVHFISALELSERIQGRTVDPVEIAESQLERLGVLQPSLKAFARVVAYNAIAEATTLRDVLRESRDETGVPFTFLRRRTASPR